MFLNLIKYMFYSLVFQFFDFAKTCFLTSNTPSHLQLLKVELAVNFND